MGEAFWTTQLLWQIQVCWFVNHFLQAVMKCEWIRSVLAQRPYIFVDIIYIQYYLALTSPTSSDRGLKPWSFFYYFHYVRFEAFMVNKLGKISAIIHVNVELKSQRFRDLLGFHHQGGYWIF
jgi:hypothetical protein